MVRGLDNYIGILKSLTDFLRTSNQEELNQFLGKYLLEGFTLESLVAEKVFG